MTIRTAPANLDHPLPVRTYRLVRRLLRLYFRLFHCIRIRGQQYIPRQGPVIIAPNHVSYYDPPIVGLAVPRQVRTMAWNALFKVPLLGWAMRKLGAFAVDPAQADAAAYKHSLQILRHGHCVIIFPEGRRSLGSDLEPFEMGVARLAIRTGATVVPATLTGALEAWPRWRYFPRLFRPVQIKFHPPLQPPSGELRGEALHEAVETINASIRRPVRRRYLAWRRLLRIKRQPLLAPPQGYDLKAGE